MEGSAGALNIDAKLVILGASRLLFLWRRFFLPPFSLFGMRQATRPSAVSCSFPSLRHAHGVSCPHPRVAGPPAFLFRLLTSCLGRDEHSPPLCAGHFLEQQQSHHRRELSDQASVRPFFSFFFPLPFSLPSADSHRVCSPRILNGSKIKLQLWDTAGQGKQAGPT